VHIFDPAGERLLDRDRTDELRYLEAARTFVFVLDPMSVPEFWSALTPDEAATLDRTLASEVHPQTVFDQVTQQIIAMGGSVRRSRLMVAISKVDLFGHTRLLDGFPGGYEGREAERWARMWLTDRLGLGNLVRAMENEFREARFFFTAAITVAPRHVHDSIPPLLSCALGLSATHSPPVGGQRPALRQ
jgi:hypothetical protein